MTIFFRISSVLIFSLIVISCNSSEKKNDYRKKAADLNSQIIQLNQNWKGKVFGPDILDQKEENDLKNLVIYLDADCTTCFAKLKIWQDKLIPEFKYKVQIQFVLSTVNSTITEINLEAINFDMDLANIKESVDLETPYPFLKDDFSNVLLLESKTNKIEFIGSPRYSEKMKDHILLLAKS